MKRTFIHRIFTRFVLLFSIAYFFNLATIDAQNTQKLSLVEAIQKGLSQNFDIQIEKQNIAIAHNNNDWGQAGRYPTILLNATQGNNYNNIVVNPAAFQEGATVNNSLLPSVALEWVLFDGFAINITKKRLAYIEAQAEGNTRIVIENAVQNIIRTYYNAVLASEFEKILKQAVDLSRDTYEYMQFKKSIGNAVNADVLLEKSNYLTDSSNYINQQLIYRNTIRDLNVLMGEIDMSKTYELTDRLNFNDLSYNLQDLEEKMFATNANLQTLQITQEILNNDVSLRKADKAPRIALNMNTNYNIINQDLSGARFANGGSRPSGIARNYGFFGNINFSIPVFNGGIIRRAVQNAEIAAKNGETRIEALKNQLRRDLTNNYELYNLRRQQVKIAEENRTAAQTNLRLSEEKFRNGSINAFDYRILQQNYLNIAFGEQQAIFNYIDANTILLRLTGGILSDRK